MTDAYPRVRVPQWFFLGWVVVVVAVEIAFVFVDGDPQRVTSDVMWALSIVAQLVQVGFLVRDRRVVGDSRGLAAQWTFIMTIGGLAAVLFSSWPALGIAVVGWVYTVVLRRRQWQTRHGG